MFIHHITTDYCVIHLTITEEEALRRLQGRRIWILSQKKYLESISRENLKHINYPLKWSEVGPALAEFGNMIIEDMKKNYREVRDEKSSM